MFNRFLLLCLFVFSLAANVAASGRANIPVTSYYGNYDASRKVLGQHALSLRGPKMEEWKLPEPPEKPFTVGVSIPHLKDSYWLAVNFGILDEAERLGVNFILREAGGYGNLQTQQKQVRELLNQGVDGIILGSVSYTDNNRLVAAIRKRGIPVIEMINDIEAQEITAKALVSFYEMGYFAGEFMANDAEEARKENVRVVFLPGPKGSGWADDTLVGFRAATEFFEGSIDLLAVEWGDTGSAAQEMLIRKVLARHGDVDYIVGNAVAASVAPSILKKTGGHARIIGTYITPQLYSLILNGQVDAAPADMTVDQARIAMGMMARVLSGEKPGRDFPFRSGPLIPVISRETIDEHPYETLFGPKDFRQVLAR